MRLALIGTGSRGDCTPIIALAVALQRRGHAVRLLTFEEHREAGERWGLEVRTLPGISAPFFGGPAGIAMRTALTRSPRAYLRFFDTYMHRFVGDQLTACLGACDGVDAVVTWPWLRVGPNVARRLGVPCIIASPTPPLYLSTRAFACPYTRPPEDPGHDVAGSWRDAEASFAAGHGAIERWRRDVGLPTSSPEQDLIAQRALPHVLGISPVLLPKPDDWDDRVELVGSFALPETGRAAIDPELRAFVEDGPPPIGVGFSSSVAPNPAAMWRTIVEAIARSGVRAVIVGGYTGLPDLEGTDRIFAVRQVPYAWLLPRSAGFVHHGGLGTTHLCLTAGCPAQVVPFGWDQPLWGRRIHELGAGPAPLPAGRLSIERLSAGLRNLAHDPSWREGTRRAGDRMRSDGGAELAAARVERWIAGPPAPN